MTRLDLSPIQLVAACTYGVWLFLSTPSADAVYWSLLPLLSLGIAGLVLEVYLNPYHPRINPLPLLITFLAAGASFFAPGHVQVAGASLIVTTSAVVLAFLLGVVVEAVDDFRSNSAEISALRPADSSSLQHLADRNRELAGELERTQQAIEDQARLRDKLVSRRRHEADVHAPTDSSTSEAAR